MFAVARARLDQRGGQLGVEGGLSAADDLRNAGRCVGVGRVALRELTSELHFARVHVRERHLRGSRRPWLDELYGTPVGQLGNRQIGDGRKRGSIVER